MTFPKPHPSYPPVTEPPPEDPDAERLGRIRERPDGYHWIDVEGRQEFGPFATLQEALADMDDENDGDSDFDSADNDSDLGLDVGFQSDRCDEDEPGDSA